MGSASAERKSLAPEVGRRRTFAIISHPDAGKTTLTEKLLLYAGMVRTAGMVRGRKSHKEVSSDWMAMEQERGISITASAMQFEYKGVVINVLDTPGHQDFSEDTYRTLTAADSAVMVIDAAKGVEAQTRKLFAVCKMRGIPILTFINKMDLPGRDPLDLMSEVEDILEIEASAMNWPIGSGKDFCGVVDRKSERVMLFSKSEKGGIYKAESTSMNLADMESSSDFSTEQVSGLRDELDLLQTAGNAFDLDTFLAGEVTPVFFGSALTNFGVEPFFDSFSELAPPPRAREAFTPEGESLSIDPLEPDFSAYVFKIQANMDLRHRDSMAYLRVCSGKFERDLVVKHERLKKEIRLSRSHSMFGGERTTIDAAYPGDIVGVVNPGVFAIGDSVSARGGFVFKPMPKFPPEVVARIRPLDVMRRKSFDKGIQQFRDEGAVLILELRDSVSADPLVAAVGPLQFEVLQDRMEKEYKVKTELEMLPYKYGAWLLGDAEKFSVSSGSTLARDGHGQYIFLYSQEWQRGYALEKNPDHELLDFVQ